MSVILRAATPPDASAIHALIAANLEAGHLLPRSIDDIHEHVAALLRRRARRTQVVGCAELARLSPSVAEVRSLVVHESLRGQKIGTRLVAHLAPRGDGGRLRDAVRVHARPVALRAARLHDRAAHLDAGEDRARLHRLRAVPPLRPVRGPADAAAGRDAAPERTGGDDPRPRRRAAPAEHRAAAADRRLSTATRTSEPSRQQEPVLA